MNTKNMDANELVNAINTLKEQIVEYRSTHGQHGDWFYVKMDGKRVLEYRDGEFKRQDIWDLFNDLDLHGMNRTISTIEEGKRYNNSTSIRIRTSAINPKKVESNATVDVIEALHECVDAIKDIVSGENEGKNLRNIEKNQKFNDSNTEWVIKHIVMNKWSLFYINGYEIKSSDTDTLKEVLKRYRDAGFGMTSCRLKWSGYFSMTMEPMFHIGKDEGNLRGELLDKLFAEIDKYNSLWFNK